MTRHNPVPRVDAKSWDVVDLRRDLGMTQETWQTTHPVDGVSRGLRTTQGAGQEQPGLITDDINPILSDFAVTAPARESVVARRPRPNTAATKSPLPPRPRFGGGSTIHSKLFAMAREKNWKPHVVEDKEDFRSNLRKASGLDRVYQQSELAHKRDARKVSPWGAGRVKSDAWEWRNPAKVTDKPKTSSRRTQYIGEGPIWDRLHGRSSEIAQVKTDRYMQTLQVERERRNRKAKDKMYTLAYSTFGEGRHNSSVNFHKVPTRDVSTSPTKEAPWERLFHKKTKKRKESSLRLTEQNPRPRFHAPPNSSYRKETIRPPRPWHHHHGASRTDEESNIDIGQWEESMYRDPLNGNVIHVRADDTHGQEPAEPVVLLEADLLQPQDHTEVAEMLCDTQISISARNHYSAEDAATEDHIPGADSKAAMNMLDSEAGARARLNEDKHQRQLAAQAARDAEAINVRKRVAALEAGKLPFPPPVVGPTRMPLKRSSPPHKPVVKAKPAPVVPYSNGYADDESEEDLAA